MPNLFPKGYDEVSPYPGSNMRNDRPIGYRPGILFDYEQRGDFVRDGRRRIVEANGIESWKSWVVNCLSTERYKHLAYSTDFGIEYDKIFGATTKAEAESILVRQVTEAILADPYKRTEYLAFTNIDWSIPDTVVASFTLYGINDVTLDMTVYLTREGH